MATIVGYKLVDLSDGAIVETWGGIWGQCPGAPNPISLPNGNIVYGMALDEEINGYKLVTWVMNPPDPTDEDVDKERDRRIGLGTDVTIGEATFPVQTRDETDFRNINGLSTKGVVMQITGDTSTIPFRDANNVQHDLTAQDLISLGSQVANRVSAMYEASWAIKDLPEIPSNYTDDSWWPA